MTWQVEIPGQPPSVNHMYERTHRSIRKSGNAEAYQAAATYIIRTKRPSGWIPNGNQIRISYDFYLQRDSDCDNLMKVLGDAIAVGLGVNDKLFLPCARSKQSGYPEPCTVVTIEELDDNPTGPLLGKSQKNP